MQFSNRRVLEADAFHSALKAEKAAFDKQVIKLTLQARARDELLYDWAMIAADRGLHLQHQYFAELMHRTAHYQPALREYARQVPQSKRTKK